MQLTGGQAAVRALKRNGIDTLFGLPGLQLDHLFNALHDDADMAPRIIHTRHEQGAGYMAFGAAQSTGRPSAYAVVPGPGFLNAAAALATAYACNAPVLCISGQILSGQIGRGVGWLHELPDQLAIARGLTKWAARADSPAQIPGLVNEAFRQMTSGRRRPATLEIPMDVLARSEAVDLPAPPAASAAAALDHDAIVAAARLLGRAANPMILVGGGIFGAEEELRALATALQAPAVMTRNAFGALSYRDPLALNEPCGYRLWPHVDVALVVGTRFQPQTVGYAKPDSMWGLDDELAVIRIDVDAAEVTRSHRPAVGIVADAKAALGALLRELGPFNARRPSRAAELTALKAAIERDYDAKVAPQIAFLRAIRAELPDDGFFVEELTQIGYIARFAYQAYVPRTYVSTGYQGTLGFGFATALGVKVANPGKQVVAISGDGGFLFTASELATAVRHGIAIAVVVFNDGAYGNVRRMQAIDHGGRLIATDLRNPDFVKMVESFGAAAERVETPHALRGALRRAFSASVPTVIEVPVGEMPDPWDFIRLPRVRPRRHG